LARSVLSKVQQEIAGLVGREADDTPGKEIAV
jgi:hypothetical protein